MKFNTEKDAWIYWSRMYEFHGAEAPDITHFHHWVEDNNITWLDPDTSEWLHSSWKGIF